MKITDDHFLEGVGQDIIAGGNPMNVRRVLVIHFTSGASAQSSIAWWRNPNSKGACAHVIIDRDGVVTQCRAFNRTCGHAGVSRWQDPESKRIFSGVNAFGIGIELANGGDDELLTAKHSRLSALMAKHRNGGPVQTWERYPNEQLKACFDVSKALVLRYRLDDVTGHDCIAPERKNDPGPAFPMDVLREHCGFSGLPKVFWP